MEHRTLSGLYQDIANSLERKLHNGYYKVDDFDLSIENIPDGSDATATPSDILSGKTGFVNGRVITGTKSSYDWSFSTPRKSYVFPVDEGEGQYSATCFKSISQNNHTIKVQ